MAIDLRKSTRSAQPRQARISRDSVIIPHYWIVNGNVVTNLQDAREYKEEYKTVR